MLETAPLTTFTVLLPVGWTDRDGARHRVVTLRKLRGHDEMLFYDPALSAAELVTQLLHRCVVRLGDREALAPADLAGLTSVDRNYLLFELRRLTLGDRLVADYHCPACDRSTRVEEDLGALTVSRLDDGQDPVPIRVMLEDGYRDPQGVLHREVTLVLTRGTDEAEVSPLAESDPLAAREALLLRAITTFGTLPRAVLQGYGVKILRELTLGDRRRLQQALSDGMPGLDSRRRVACGHCGTVIEAMLDVSDFFGER